MLDDSPGTPELARFHDPTMLWEILRELLMELPEVLSLLALLVQKYTY